MTQMIFVLMDLRCGKYCTSDSIACDYTNKTGNSKKILDKINICGRHILCIILFQISKANQI